jgi:translation elongation factor EF-4
MAVQCEEIMVTRQDGTAIQLDAVVMVEFIDTNGRIHHAFHDIETPGHVDETVGVTAYYFFV